MVSLKIKIIKPFGIHQSSWNSLFRRNESPYYFYADKEEDLKKSIKEYFDTSTKDCQWNFNDIGWHHFDQGFFSNTHFISCSNCSGGKIEGYAETKIAKVQIIKESGNQESPKNGLFSTDILEEKFVLWDIEINVKCNKCDKKSHWHDIQTTYDEGNKNHWNFSHFSDSFSKIK